MRLLLLILALAGLAAGARAAEPLTLAEVLQSSARQSPAIVEAMIKVRQAEGKLLSSRGAFDVVFEGEALNRPFGFYDGTYAEARATRPLETNGGGLYGGYRISQGKFPVYEDKYYTNQAGDVFLGGYYSLLRDRYVDSRRTAVSLARLDVDLAAFDREMVALGVQRRAVSSYQNWVAAGQRVAIYRRLLKLAEDRQAGIARQITLGARPQILGVENSQNIVRRQTLLARAEQELAQAANDLSFYYRDSEGERIVPTPDRLPGSFPTLSVPMAGPDIVKRINRPDLTAITARIEQTETRLRLAQNELKPRLDVRAEVAQSIGPVGSGGPSRDDQRGYVGLKFSVPLEQRSARGKIAEAQAEQDALRVRQRLIEDQILVELNGLAVAVDAAERLTGLAARETELSESLADAERKRFAAGLSDLILVNIREEAAAEARLRQLDTEYRRATARAELVAASADRAQLGL